MLAKVGVVKPECEAPPVLRTVAGFRPPPTNATDHSADAAGEIQQGRGTGYPGAEPRAERAEIQMSLSGVLRMVEVKLEGGIVE
jgi:hypothetical protein